MISAIDLMRWASLFCHVNFSVGLMMIHVQVTLVELVKPSPSLPEILTGIGNSLVGADRILKQLLDELAVSDGIQARMDGIMFQKLEGADYSSPILTMVKDYLGSLWLQCIIVRVQMSFIAAWQSPQTLRFLYILMGAPCGTYRRPNATANFSLW